MKISQVVSNLLSNAFKFTDKGDTITITISRRFKLMNMNSKQGENDNGINNDKGNIILVPQMVRIQPTKIVQTEISKRLL
jgi:signal transduction histidine kinase